MNPVELNNLRKQYIGKSRAKIKQIFRKCIIQEDKNIILITGLYIFFKEDKKIKRIFFNFENGKVVNVNFSFSE